MVEAYLAESLIAQKRWGDAERHLKHVLESSEDEAVKEFASALYEGLKNGVFQEVL